MTAFAKPYAFIRSSIVEGTVPRAAISGDLLTFCHGFCRALEGHHSGEDPTLFPAIAAAHPGLEHVLRSLQEDHSMLG